MSDAASHMTYAVELDPARRITFVSVGGVCSVDDMRRVQRAVAETPGFDPSWAQLADFSDVIRFEASVLDLISLARSAPFAADAIRAYVAPADWAFGLVRSYTLASETIGKQGVGSFRDRGAALAWIAAQQAARADKRPAL